jgi:glutamate:GABA antiporter
MPPSRKTEKVTTRQFALATFLVVVVLSNAPAAAQLGVNAAWLLALGAILVLLPSILVPSELATTFNRDGGMYVWVKEAYGPRAGFLSTWFQWLPRVIVVPTIISFIASTLAYGFSHDLATNPVFLVIVILAVTWGSVWLNWMGVKESVRATTYGAVLGNIGPSILLIGLAIWYAFSDAGDVAVEHLMATASQPLHVSMLTLALASFIGLEITANFVESLHEPKRTYRKALLIAGGCAVVVTIGAPLAIALTVPAFHINVVSGVMQAFELLLREAGVEFLMIPLGIVMGLATITQAAAFLLAPAMGISIASRELDLARPLQRMNKHGAPANILIAQGFIVTGVSLVFIFAPTANAAFQMILILVVALYLVGYLLMYSAAIWLRYSRPELERPCPVPGGKVGLWLVAGSGFLSALFLIVVSFVPSPDVGVSSEVYVGFMVVGFVVATAAPFGMKSLREHGRNPTE